MYEFSLPVAIAYTLSAVFGVVGIVQLAGIDAINRTYLRWGYPLWIVRLTGVVELLAAVLLAVPATRPVGIGLAAGVNFVVVVLLLKNRAYFLAAPGIAVAAILPLALLPS